MAVTLVQGAVIGTVRLPLFSSLAQRGGVIHARTQAFVVLALALMVHSFCSRHRTRSVFSAGFLANPSLLAAVALSGVALAASSNCRCPDGSFRPRRSNVRSG